MNARSPLHASAHDRLIAGAGTTAIVGLLGYMLLTGLTGEIQRRAEESLVLLNIRTPPQPPQIHAEIEPRVAKAIGKASPRNLKNKATEVVAPRSTVLMQPTVVSAPKPELGNAPSAGASNLPGPGNGSGGVGDGSGNGGEGDGDDGEPPRQIKGKLKTGDLPPYLRLPGTRRSVGVRYEVGSDGYVSNCRAALSSGNAELDHLTCRLIEQRFRFRPSRNEEGRPVSSIIEEDHTWIVDPSDTPPD